MNVFIIAEDEKEAADLVDSLVNYVDNVGIESYYEFAIIETEEVK
jgi:hypothetical protein